MAGSMRPRISGLLHNCALNCSLPTILKQIETFAELEVSDPPGLPANDQPIYQNYLTLKRIFANSYGIGDEEQLSWTILNRFLKAHSFAAVELIFSPVLREALKVFARQSRVHDFDGCTTIQSNGRYSMIDYYQVNEYFNHKLHIHGANHLYNSIQGYADTAQYEPQPNPPEGAKQIKVYFKRAHYELNPHENLAKANKRYIRQLRALPPLLTQVVDEISMSKDAYVTNKALAKLFIYTNRELHRVITGVEQVCPDQEDKTEEHLINAEQYVRMTESFDVLPYSEQVLKATILLTILESSSKDKERVLFLVDKMGQAGYRRAARLGQAIFRHWDNLEHEDVQHAADAINIFTPDSDFYLACMISLAVGGAALLVAGLFLSGSIAAIVAVVGAVSVLSAAGMFAGRCSVETEVDHIDSQSYERQNPRGIAIY